MAIRTAYKQKGKQSRQSTVETDFSKGMQFTNGVVQEGYVKTLVNFDFTDDTNVLVPRAGLRTSEFIFPDPDYPASLDGNDPYFGEDVTIKDAKECIENGEVYRQFILGRYFNEPEDPGRGSLYVRTIKKMNHKVSPLDDERLEEFPVDVAYITHREHEWSDCHYYTSDLISIHDTELEPDAKVAKPVGTFGFNNNYYFFGWDRAATDTHSLKRTVFNDETKNYYVESVDPITNSPAEAVYYGYNMLLDDPYTFANSDSLSAGNIELQGILPYSVDRQNVRGDLLMSPRQNQLIYFEAYYSAGTGTYDVIWEWTNVDSDDWNEFGRSELIVSSGSTPSLTKMFRAPAADIMVRVQVKRRGEDVAVHAMTVGFDFSKDETNSAENLKQENYNLYTASGMVYWKNRLVLWGVPKDPTILFISDLNEPGYFPYPNNIVVMDEPVVAALEFMDKLIVFTTSKVCSVEYNSDGASWTTTVLQTNLRIDPWDRHLIQPVRNMIYFKSGNYYYMLVPKAQSQTGELTLAPISTPITEFFNRFSTNVADVFKETYRTSGDDLLNYDYKLLNYFNFLDYENVHNIYVYQWEENSPYIHFDIIYNTVDRYWKICIFESPHFLYPYMNNATQYGNLASTSTMYVLRKPRGSSEVTIKERFLQIFRFDPMSVQDFYIPTAYQAVSEDGTPTGNVVFTTLVWDEAHECESYEDDVMISPVGYASYSNETATFSRELMDYPVYKDGVLYFSDAITDYVHGYNMDELKVLLEYVQKWNDQFFKFRNYQFLDTGYRDDEPYYNKRYRELQLRLNNIDNNDLQFGMDFLIAGEPRRTMFKYEVSQVIDEMVYEYNIAYVDVIPFMDIPVDEIDLSNLWTLRKGVDPEISLWKVRANVSGKGVAPRMKLYSRNEVRYQLLGIDWVYRMMHMR